MTDEPPPIKRRHPDAHCEECPLQQHGLFVPSTGPAEAQIAFVGEAAGKAEVNIGAPFVGPSGKLLNKVLAHHGIDRRKVFLSNASLCRPPGSENVAPPQSAIRACRPRLVKELQDRGVTTVVALGNTAAQSLVSSSDGVTKLRVGWGRTSPHLENVRVVSTFHPAACLRVGDFFPSMVMDIGKIKRPPPSWEPPKYRVFNEEEDAVRVIEELINHTGDRLVIDIETDTEKDTAFDHPNNYELLCIGLGYDRKRVVVIERDALKLPRVLEALGRLLRKKKLIAQNGKYDLAGLFPKIGQLKLWFDTMLASYALDERPGIHSLDYQGVEKLGTPEWKRALDKYNPKKNGYGIIPREVLDRYNAYDVATTWELAEYYIPRLEKPQPYWPYSNLEPRTLRDVHDFLVEASNELVFLELNGIKIDRPYNDELMSTYLGILDILRSQIIETINDPDWSDFNPNSPLQVKKVVKQVFGMSIPQKRNQKGEMAESSDEETLKLLLSRSDPQSKQAEFFRLMLEHRKEAKLYGTYIKGIRKRMYRGRVYPNFLLHGTTSGRLACRNPNLQNIPRASKIRAQFIPATDSRVFVSVDYSQAELRVLAWLAQEEYFRNIFNDPDRDLFSELAPVLYGDIPNLSPAARKEQRIRIKAYVYGLSYGREAGSIATEFGISFDEAQEGMDAFFGVIPNIVAFQQNVKKTIRAGQDLISPFGRHRRFYLLTPENVSKSEKEALSFLPQSTSSDLCLRALTRARPALRGKAFIRNIVHDNIMAECEEKNAEEVAHIINTCMLDSARELVGDYVRFGTDTTIGRSWGEV